jgi:hypothetical protein
LTKFAVNAFFRGRDTGGGRCGQVEHLDAQTLFSPLFNLARGIAKLTKLTLIFHFSRNGGDAATRSHSLDSIYEVKERP